MNGANMRCPSFLAVGGMPLAVALMSPVWQKVARVWCCAATATAARIVTADLHHHGTVIKSKYVAQGLRGGGVHVNRKQDWETAVKRGKGGFPGPCSWDPMEEETLRVKAETLLAPEVCRVLTRTFYY